VRDHGEESYDLPPDVPLPDSPLVLVEDKNAGKEATGGSDLRRADQAAASRGETAVRSVLDVFDQTAGQW